MAAKRERSTLDTTKLLDLLLRLAKSDQQVRAGACCTLAAAGCCLVLPCSRLSRCRARISNLSMGPQSP